MFDTLYRNLVGELVLFFDNWSRIKDTGWFSNIVRRRVEGLQEILRFLLEIKYLIGNCTGFLISVGIVLEGWWI